MTTQSVQVKLELGHKALLRTKHTKDGFTHDWTVYVRGPEGSNIQHFVDKVVFHLHESFPKPKRTIKEPPYQVGESGYGGFTLPIEIYFKNKEEPRKIRFEYDLFLHLENCPPVNHIRCEKLTFKNPTEEFRRKLIKAGGIGIPGPNDAPSSVPREVQPANGTTIPTPENKTFNDLFGTPFKADTSAKKPKPSSKEKTAGKPSSMTAAMLSSGDSTPSSVTASTKEKPSSTASSASKERPPKRPTESPPPSKSVKKKKKDKDRDREKDRDKKEEKSKHKKHKKKDKRESKDPDLPPKSLSPPDRPAERPSERPSQAFKSPAKAPLPSGKAIPEPSKTKPALTPFEDMLSTGEQSDFEDMPVDMAHNISNASSHSFSSLKQSSGNKPLAALYSNMIGSDNSLSDEDDGEILSPVRTSPPALFQQSHHQVAHNQNSQIPVLEREKTEKPASSRKKEKSSKKSKSEKKSKESSKEKESKERKEHELSEKENKVDNDNDDNDSGVEHGNPSTEVSNHSASPHTEDKAPNGEYLVALLQLQRSLMTLTDRKLLQDVVRIIEDTGLFKISDATFDFDLCCLDAKTVRRLNELISNASAT